MEKENLSTIWPILYFKADWPSKSYSFDLGVQVIKADKTTLEEITELNIDNNCWLSNIEGADNMRYNTDWFLAVHRPEVTEHISVSEIGVSFVDSLHRAIVESFLMCLQLVRSTAAICPFEFPAEICEDSIVDVDTSSDFYGINSDKPHVYSKETFEVGDLQLLTFLWSALIKLRKFDFWKELINKEEFFAACDKKAGEDAMKELVEFLMSHPSYADVSEQERKRAREQWTSSVKEAKNKGDEWWKEFYKKSFPKVFSEKQEEVFSSRTRIGRALNLFYEGLDLPLLHSFLSMCLVLETLYTIGEGEILHKLAVRTAKIVGKDQTLEQRKDIYRRTKKVYAARSDIVHGEKLIDVVDPEVLKDAFTLARHSLQSILLSDHLSILYSSPGTTDRLLKGKRKRQKDTSYKAIRDFFLDLDLDAK